MKVFIGLKYGNCYSVAQINFWCVCAGGKNLVGEHGFPSCRDRLKSPLPAKDLFITPT